MSKHYDLAVIGGGPGGYVAAIRALQLGLSTAVIEEREMGGTCLNRGCIPTKSLLHCAAVYRTVRTAGRFGVHAGNASYDYAEFAAEKDSHVRQLRAGVESLVKGNKGVIYTGRACLSGNRVIRIKGGREDAITADKTIIATGSKPLIPNIPGIGGPNVLDSDAALNMRSCPGSIVIIGGGVIGVEFATLFNMLGKNVTVVEMTDHILPGMDEEISDILRRSLEKKGVRIFTGAKVTAINPGADAAGCAFLKDGRERNAAGDIVIVAIGRKPCSADMGLENAGVAADEKGFITVNDEMETSADGIYAVGDVTGRCMLAHAASAQGLVAAANAAGRDEKMDYSAVPGCVYADPEIAAVGLTEKAAVQKGLNVKTGSYPVGMNGRSRIMGETEGTAKIVADKTTGEILGAHIMAPRATDMIAEICAAMKLESTVEEFKDVIHPHPTVSEIIMEAANDVDGMCINKPPRR